MLDALPVSGEGKPSSHPAYRGQASPHLSSLTLRMQFHPSEQCVEPRGLTCSLPHCALRPCPSNVMCWQRWSLLAPHTHVHAQACTHTRTGAVHCPASLRLCSGASCPRTGSLWGHRGRTVSSLPAPTPPEASVPPGCHDLQIPFLSQSGVDDHPF